MRHNPRYAVTDAEVVRRLIADNPWATLVSTTAEGIVASHYPILLDASATEPGDPLAIVTHVGRPDEEVHGLGSGEVLLIVAGPNGYISPSWYTDEATPAPTWHFTVAHCWGTPEVLTADENVAVLTRLVDAFEQHVEDPVSLDPALGARLGPMTCGIRLPIARFACKAKLGQDLDAGSRRNVIERLRKPGPYEHPVLAGEMERVLRQAAGKAPEHVDRDRRGRAQPRGGGGAPVRA
jgi:transcriptional regulator